MNTVFQDPVQIFLIVLIFYNKHRNFIRSRFFQTSILTLISYANNIFDNLNLSLFRFNLDPFRQLAPQIQQIAFSSWKCYHPSTHQEAQSHRPMASRNGSAWVQRNFREIPRCRRAFGFLRTGHQRVGGKKVFA